MRTKSLFVATALVAGLSLVSCGGSKAANSDVSSTEVSSESTDRDGSEPVTGSDTPSGSETESVFDADLFVDGALVSEPTLVDCTLADGSNSQCFELTAVGSPAGYEVGPFCPTTTDANDSEGGIWFDGDRLYDVDGEFILGLEEIYGEGWKLYDDNGNVNVVESAEEFDLAARPDVDESLVNHCVEGRYEWLEGGEAVPYEAIVPANPTLAESSSNSAVLGVTANGIRIDGSAPVDAILAANTIAAFDDCGGHFNPVEGYHMHAAIDCATPTISGGDADLFGFAADGFPILLQIEETSDLDECGGHESEQIGYHYHASAPEENAIINCLSGLTLEGSDDDTGGPDGGEPPAGGERPAR